MSYSAKETFKNGRSCDYCLMDDDDFECTCMKQCGERICKGAA